MRDKLRPGLKKAANQLNAFGATIRNAGAGLAGIGAGILGPISAAAGVFAHMGDEVKKSSQRTGVAVEALSELKYAAEQSGSSLEELEIGLRGMSRFMLEAKNSSGEAMTTLAQLGLTFSDLKSLSPDEQFKLIGDSISRISDPTLKSAMAMKVFGKSGTALLPLLAEGAAGVSALQERARELGLTMSGEDAEAAVRFGDILEDLWKQAKMVTFHIGAAVAQALQPWLERATQVAAKVIAWVKANRALVVNVALVAAGFVAAGSALIAFGATVQAVAFAIKGVGTVLSVIGSVVSFIASPIGIVTALLVAGAAAWAIYTKSGRQAMSDLFQTATTTFAAIADALKAGDIALAGEILWTALKLAWAQGTAALQATWAKFKATFVQTAVAAFYGMLEVWAKVQASLERLWASASSTFVSLWASAVESVTKMFDFLERREREREKARIDRDVASGKITQAQGDKQKANVDTQANQVLAARAAKDAADQAQREADARARVAAINEDEKKTLQEISDAEQAINAAATQNSNDEIAKLQADKSALEAKLKELRERAGREAGAAPSGAPSPAEQAAAGLDLAQKASAARVTFNAKALQSLQGGSGVQERTAKASEKTAQNTERMLLAIKSSEGLFA